MAFEESIEHRENLADNGFFWLLAGIIILVMIAIGFYLFWPGKEQNPTDAVKLPEQKPLFQQEQSPVHEALSLPAVPEKAIRPEGAPIGEHETAPSLPVLNNSDTLARQLASGVSEDPQLMDWLKTSNDLIRRSTLLVHSLATGALPARQHFPFPAPKSAFLVQEKEGYFTIDPKGYERYNAITKTFASIDADQTIHLYRKLKPLLQEAFSEFGPANQTFEESLGKAIDELLRAPVLEGEIRLVRPSVMYKFADPVLESLSAAQKQLIRMGPRNTQLIQAKLREFKEKLSQNAGDSTGAP